MAELPQEGQAGIHAADDLIRRGLGYTTILPSMCVLYLLYEISLWKAGSGRRPVEPEMSALRREFDGSSACSSSSSMSLEALQILAGRCMEDVASVLKEMRAFAVKTGEAKQVSTMITSK